MPGIRNVRIKRRHFSFGMRLPAGQAGIAPILRSDNTGATEGKECEIDSLKIRDMLFSFPKPIVTPLSNHSLFCRRSFCNGFSLFGRKRDENAHGSVIGDQIFFDNPLNIFG